MIWVLLIPVTILFNKTARNIHLVPYLRQLAFILNGKEKLCTTYRLAMLSLRRLYSGKSLGIGRMHTGNDTINRDHALKRGRVSLNIIDDRPVNMRTIESKTTNTKTFEAVNVMLNYTLLGEERANADKDLGADRTGGRVI